MFGLIIPQPRLGNILDGWVHYDRRQFSTQKRGRIALVDPELKAVVGFTDLVSVKTISYDEYVEQHGKEISGDMWKRHRNYYELRFMRTVRLEKPEPVDMTDETVWIEVPDDLEAGRKQSSLFDF